MVNYESGHRKALAESTPGRSVTQHISPERVHLNTTSGNSPSGEGRKIIYPPAP